MCGRYTITVTLEELMLRFHLDMPTIKYHIPRYNVAPMQQVMAIVHDGEHNRIGELRWGLVPSWAKDAKSAASMINARSETLLEKPAFKSLIHRKRCLIPADGFYEWKKEGTAKQPMRIVMKDRDIFSMAGLYDTWLSQDGTKISTCTIITTAPNRLVEPIHNRMPVILRPEDEQTWLNRSNPDVGLLMSLLKPYDDREMSVYPVSSTVGNVKNDSEDCIEEVPSLF
ncbi:SOS response-associated peptidase [Paenibacillus radicis (ex Xue et al. 2023)]|uniref:Abasic site processing protein n=1 Tax=Paenibacillus radicis (ex Xue et al. 2023) TaxID=2972489 RepID=A0ABT1YMB1_9BACL|nr:SOS response-associated peptidase [Paenibacillus radicis (ex Xue et al. 2023)]MCR8634313.1 SOS response-associated peptidase [Paenibacillus radicis (ex Xue et al. 2023)]